MLSNLSDARGTRVLFVAACVVIVVAGLRAGATILVPFSLALLLAVLSLPLLLWLRGKRVPTPVAILLTMLVNIAVLGVIALVVSQSVTELRAAMPRYVDRVQVLTVSTTDWLQARRIPVNAWVSPDLINPESILNLVGGTLRSIASLLSSAFLVLLIMVFMLAEATWFPAKLRLVLGANGPADMSRWNKATREVQQYLRIKTAVSLATGTAVGVWVWFLGVDFPLFWGLIAFLFNYVPNVGSILAAIPPVLLALLQFGLGRAAAVGAGYLVVNVVLGNFLEPNLQGRKFGLSPLFVILSLVFWGWAWGPLGMILSLPLTMILKIMLEHTEDLRWVAVLMEGPLPAGRTAPPPPRPAPVELAREESPVGS